jgi:hypothetical protein
MIAGKYVSRCLLLVGALLAIAAVEPPSGPIVLSPEQATKEGKALVDEMLTTKPDASSTSGIMSIRASKKFTQVPIKFQTVVTPTNWVSVYEAKMSNRVERISILHNAAQPSVYFSGDTGNSAPLNQEGILKPFADSDFSIADLGLEFLHWPDQRLLQKEMKRSRSCRVLESINPHPVAGGYARVKSWVDAESHGILYAEAYDASGKELKEFLPKDFDKVDGQWQLHEMQISTVPSGSRTTVKFDLGK